jgi:predicted dehydrogenase
MDVYAKTGYIKTLKSDHIEVRREGESEGHITSAEAVPAPYDDPLHYLAAVIHGDIQEEGSLSSLETNITVSEILDAARESSRTGRTVRLPLSH